jgi:large subunit ribosomal protein L22
MEIKSTQKYIIASSKKIREVVPLIRKLSPVKAYEILPFSGKRAGMKLRKVVGSALANAKQKGIKEESLFFKEIQVTDGPRLKRFRAGARGMAKPYVRKLSHIRIVLGVNEDKVVENKKSGLIPNKKNVGTENTEKISEGTEKPVKKERKNAK